MIKTDVDDFIANLNAGVLKEKLEVNLSELAQSVSCFGESKNPGKLALEFTITPLGGRDGTQVRIQHKLKTVTPTTRGKKQEEDTTETDFFVGKGGRLTIDAPQEYEGGQLELARETEVVKKINRKK